MKTLKTKWPIYDDNFILKKHVYRTNYINRTTELVIDTEKCKICKQCTKACPRSALKMPIIKKGKKVQIVDRMPIMPEQKTCVFCGVCAYLCPFGAISLKIDGKEQSLNSLALKTQNILPNLKSIKIRKIELEEEHFSNPFWDAILERISV